MNVDRILRQLTWRQLREWMDYEAIEPFGDRRADWQAASICTAFANVTLATKGASKRFKVHEFLLEFGKQKDAVKEGSAPGKTWQQMKFIAQMMTAQATEEQAKKSKRTWRR